MKLAVGCLLLVLGFFMHTLTTEAASLYIQPNTVEINRGDTVAMAVRLDTDEDECVNIVDAVIHYSPNIEPVDTSRGNSILSLWVEEPIINKNERTITFAGGIPNGYCGRIPGDPRLSNTVVELLFRSPGMVVGAVEDSDTAIVSFGEETKVYFNDGFGNQATPSTYGAEITLLKKVGQTIANEWSERITADTIPPEEFRIELVRTPNAFSNRYYITFNTTDKQSGIDHYEVMEEPMENINLFRWGAADAPWLTARSPYVLKDQSLNSIIRVRAVDKAGNEYVTMIIPDESQRTLSTQGKIIIALAATIILLVIGGVVTTIVLWRYRQRKKVMAVPAEDASQPHEESL